MSDRESYSEYDDPAPVDAEIARLREEIEFAHRAQKYAELTAGKAWATVELRDAEIAQLREDAARKDTK